jgi:hypothetical protein
MPPMISPADDRTQYSDDCPIVRETRLLGHVAAGRRRAATIRQRQMEEPRPCWKRLSIPRTRRPTSNRNNQCEIFSSQPPPSSWPERICRSAQSASCPRGRLTISCSYMALSSTRRAGSPLPISSRRRATTSRSSKIRSPPLPRTSMPPNRRWRSRTAGPFSSATPGAAWSSRKPATIPRSRRWSTSPRSRPTSENLWRPWPRPVRRPKAPRRFIPTQRATSTSIPRCFLRRSRLTFPRRSPNPWRTHQLPLNHTAFEAPVDTAAWRDKPTFYVISTKDKVIAPEAQKMFAARMKAQTTEVAGSHAFARRPCEGSRRGDRKGRAREVTDTAPGAFAPGATGRPCWWGIPSRA